MSTIAQASSCEPAAALFGQTRRRVLGWLLGHPDEAFYLREIVRRTGAAQGAVQRELETLTRGALLRRTVQGHYVYFEANRESPIFSELHALFLKTSSVVDVLRDGLLPVVKQTAVAFVSGEAARGQLRRGTDLELIVVGTASFTRVANAVAAVTPRLGRRVNPIIYRTEEFRSKIRGGDHFLTTVISEPQLFIIGGANELRELGATLDRASEGPRNPVSGSARRRGAGLTNTAGDRSSKS